MRGVAWKILFAVCATSVLRAASAHAAPPALVTLEYEVAQEASGCPNIEEFQSSVARQLGYDPFRPGADRRVAVRIARKEPGFAGAIQWSDASGRWVGDRRLSSQRVECSEIAANVAFAVAVQIQLLAALAPATSEPSSPAAEPGPAPTATTGPPDAKAVPPAQPDDAAERTSRPGERGRPRDRLTLFAGLGASLALGLAPHATGVGRIFVGGQLAPISLELAFDGALPASQRQPDGSGFSLTRFTLGAAACGNFRPFAACLTGTFGRLEARGFGLDEAASPAGLFSQVGGRVVATYNFSDRFFASARVDGLVMLTTWTVTLNDGIVWTTPRVGGLAGLDFGVNFF
jgi:hypothetical protein